MMHRPNHQTTPRTASFLFLGIGTLLVVSLALTNESLWIDEAHSALKAVQPSLADWWRMLASERGSDLQMPFYMFYLWAWEKIAGHSEIALRAANGPWFLLGQYVLFRSCRRSGLNPWPLCALAAAQPFLWFYLNEARPYLMQYAAACVLCALLFRAAQDSGAAVRPAALWVLTGGLLVLCGSSLLGVIWAAFAGVAWLWLVRDQFRNLRRPRCFAPLAAAALSLAILGAYYFWTLRVGGRASDIGRTDLANVAFALYELLGLAGLGPGRLEIRAQGIEAFRQFGLLVGPLLIAGLAVAGLFAWSISRVCKRSSSRVVVAGCVYSLPPLLLLFALAYIQDFRLLGRHLMPLLPVILGSFALGFSQIPHRVLAKILCASVVVIWLASSLSLRFAPRHRRDDYRTAAALAKSALAQNEGVWWSADTDAAAYYGVSLDNGAPKSARLVIAPSRKALENQPIPALIVASKFDIYDPEDQLGSFLRSHSFAPVQQLPAFKIWRRPAPVPR